MKSILSWFTLSIVAGFFGWFGGDDAQQQSPKMNYNFNGNGDDYAAQWLRIDSLAAQGQYETARTEVLTVLAVAQQDKNVPQTIKALTYKGRFDCQLTENGFEKSITDWETETAKAEFPQKQIMQSMLGEMYVRYRDNNYYKLSSRTELEDDDSTADLATQTLGQLNRRATALHLAALEEPRLKQLKIQDFAAILTPQVNTEALRPMLYDYLAYRAVQHFQNTNSALTEPVYAFELTQPEAFADAPNFAAFAFPKTKNGVKDDKYFSQKWAVLKCYQDITTHNITTKNAGGLLDVNLSRLAYAYANTTILNKTEVYTKALENLQKANENNEGYAEVSSALAQQYIEKAAGYQPKQGDSHKWDKKKAVEILDAALQKYPKSYGGQLCRNLRNSITAASCNLQFEAVNAIGEPWLCRMDYNNMSKMYWRVIALSEKEQAVLQQKAGSEDYGRTKFFEQVLQITPLKKGNTALPTDGDYNTHGVELRFDGMPSGRYYVLVSDNENFQKSTMGARYSVVSVSNITYFTKKIEKGTMQLIAADRLTGKPLVGAKVELLTGDYDYASRSNIKKTTNTLTTDANGSVTIPKINRNLFVHISYKNDDFYSDNNMYAGGYDREMIDREQVNFFLDRKIYRPGQLVYFKGIALSYDKKQMPSIKANKKIDVSFRDANGQEVARQSFITNEYGSFNGNFTAPAGGLLGRMNLMVENLGSIDFRVEEYKRPRFEVKFDTLKGEYRLGDKVEVKLMAKNLAGNVLDGAAVKYTVTRTARLPYMDYYWRGYSPYAGSQTQIAVGTGVTNDKGELQITFIAEADKTVDAKDKPVFTYSVNADVIDTNGEQHSQAVSVEVGYISLLASLTAPASIALDSTLKIGIVTNNLNGVHQAAKGTVEVFALRKPSTAFRNRYWEKPDLQFFKAKEFKAYFPNYAYGEEDLKPNWERGKALYQTDFDSKKDAQVQVGSMRAWSAGEYVAVINTKDNLGNKIENKTYFTVYSPKASSAPNNDLLWVNQDKTAYQPNETAQIMVASGYKNATLWLELYDKDKLVRSERFSGAATFAVPILEAYRGDIHYKIIAISNNRATATDGTIHVPWTNKDLKIEFSTFRDKLLPGAQEEWRIKVSGAKKDKVAAELLAAMYDASLDEFAINSYAAAYFPTYNSLLNISLGDGYHTIGADLFNVQDNNSSEEGIERSYREQNWFDFPFYNQYYNSRERLVLYSAAPSMSMRSDGNMKNVEAAVAKSVATAAGGIATGKMEQIMDSVPGDKQPFTAPGMPAVDKPTAPKDAPKVRTNLNETVFFFPNLYTDENGDVIIKFTMNEALTRWKFLGLAHTKDLQTATFERSVVTQKDLMVITNMPRFIRESDDITITAKVSNLTKQPLAGTAELVLENAVTGENVTKRFVAASNTTTFNAPALQSAPVSWQLHVSDGFTDALTWRIVAKSGTFSDGEESTFPVLTNRQLVIETMPLPVRGGEAKTFDFKAMGKAMQSKTLQQQNYTLEFTSNPAWYAIQSLPYLMEYPHECSEQLFSRYYANSLATSVANSHPKIKKVFDAWRGTDAMLSNLSKNEDLKYALRAETPWVLDAQSEEAQRRNIGLLFDLNKMSNEQRTAFAKLEQRQSSNGGFVWFAGGRDDRYITQYILEGIGHLNKLGVTADSKAVAMANKAIVYCDARLVEDYNKIKYSVAQKKTKWEDNHLNYEQVQYLYSRSFFVASNNTNTNTDKNTTDVLNYYYTQCEKYWLTQNDYAQGMIALSLSRNAKPTTAALILKSLKERALKSDEMGMYWQYPRGYWWYESPIETQALLIEVFDEVGKDAAAVESLKTWLLKNRQTNAWHTTKATAAAVYALLRTGDNWLLADNFPEIKVGDWAIAKVGAPQAANTKYVQTEAGSGYFKTKWAAAEITPNMSTVKVKNTNKVPAWGSVYWQYFEQLDKIQNFKDTPLQLTKTIMKKESSMLGDKLVAIPDGSSLSVGDKLTMRIELRADRDMEYVHLKDGRAAGFEPINTVSTYKYQGGLGYYEETRDAATNFFFDHLRKGTYIFEYPVTVQQQGNFSCGIATIQCMYAPEFTSHSNGIRLTVK